MAQNGNSGGWKKSLARLLRERNAAKRDGSVASFATQDKRADVLYQAFREIRELGYRLEDVSQLSGRHIEALTKSWEAQNLSPATLQNNLSILRTFSHWIGKDGLVKSSDKYFSTPLAAKRSTVATVDKSWSAKGIDTEAKIAEVRMLEPRVAIQLELQREFGLRPKEAMMLRPHYADKTAYLAVNHGTKGGRDRTVPITNERQREVLTRAKALAPRNGSTSDPQRTLSQWKNHYYSVIRAAGVKREAGITSHGLRHERLNEVYREVAGHASPIQGGKIESPETHKAACQEVVEIAGHSDAAKSSAYIGSAG